MFLPLVPYYLPCGVNARMQAMCGHSDFTLNISSNTITRGAFLRKNFEIRAFTEKGIYLTRMQSRDFPLVLPYGLRIHMQYFPCMKVFYLST